MICIYSIVISLLPTSKWCSPPNLAVPSIECRSNLLQTVASSKHPRQRRDWTDTETSLLWELCETAYSLGKLTGKQTRANSGRWDNLEKDFNPELASRNMATRTLQQMKEKINNLKSDHKKNKDWNHKQTGKPNPTNLCGLTWLIMLFSSKDKINYLFLFCSSEGRYENKKRQNIKRKARVIEINLVMEMKCLQLLHQKEWENATLIATASQAIWSKHPVKGCVRQQGLKSQETKRGR